MKKTLATVLALIMALTMLPNIAFADTTSNNCTGTCDHAAKIDATHYDTLEAAFGAVTDGVETTITVLKDCKGNGIIVNSGKKLTVDFQNHTYKVVGPELAGSTGTKSQAFQLLKDSKITFKNGTIIMDATGGGMLIQNYSNLTLENMILRGDQNTKQTISYVLSNNCGTVNITGNTSITAASGNVAFDVYGGYMGYTDVSVTVDTTGTITGKIELDRSSKYNNNNKVTLNFKNGTHNGEISVSNLKDTDKIIITGGSFSSKVKNEYVGNGIYVKKDGDYYVYSSEPTEGTTYVADEVKTVNESAKVASGVDTATENSEGAKVLAAINGSQPTNTAEPTATPAPIIKDDALTKAAEKVEVAADVASEAEQKLA